MLSSSRTESILSSTSSKVPNTVNKKREQITSINSDLTSNKDESLKATAFFLIENQDTETVNDSERDSNTVIDDG